MILARQPQAIQLRYMQTLMDIAGDKSHTIVFPMPLELLNGLLNLGAQAGPAAAAGNGSELPAATPGATVAVDSNNAGKIQRLWELTYPSWGK